MSDVLGDERVATSSVTAARTDDHLFVVLVTPPGPQRRLVANALVDRGIRVAAVSSLHELRTALDRLRPDIVIVDLAAAADRLDVLRLVRTVGAPLIATSVRNPALRAELLLTGADDCLPASFAPEELTARIIAVVRRAYRDTPPESTALMRSDPLQIDVRARCVRVHGSEVFLTPKEFALLSCFVRHSGEVLSRDRLLAEVWGYTVGDAATVTVHVRRLRSKVEADASHPELIQTVWGIGYRFCADDHRAGAAGPIRPPAVLTI
jgi:DNA-binding response OmpR family regulator